MIMWRLHIIWSVSLRIERTIHSYICSTGSSTFLHFLLFRLEALLLCEINFFFLSISDCGARGSRFASSTAFVMTYDSTTFSFYFDSHPPLFVSLLTDWELFMCRIHDLTIRTTLAIDFSLVFPFLAADFPDQLCVMTWEPHTKNYFSLLPQIQRELEWIDNMNGMFQCQIDFYVLAWQFIIFFFHLSLSLKQLFTCDRMCPFLLSSPP